MKINSSIPCALSQKLIIYGSFAVLCQLIFITLSANITLLSHSAELVRYIHLPYLEYPLVSFALIIGGGALIDYVNLNK